VNSDRLSQHACCRKARQNQQHFATVRSTAASDALACAVSYRGTSVSVAHRRKCCRRHSAFRQVVLCCWRIDTTPTQCPDKWMHIIDIQGRTFIALRRLGPRSRGTRPVFHAVSPHCRMALCSIEPGNSSGWAEPPAAEVTCSVCLQRLRRLEANAVRPKTIKATWPSASTYAREGRRRHSGSEGV
jgi:hypothetical protein